jgi:ribosome-binding factor A
MSKHRMDRISEEVKRVVSEIIRNSIKDPRVSSLSSVMEAQVTPDLKYAKIYVSVLGSEEERESTIKGLNNAAGFIRRELGNNMKLRYSPEIVFELDRSIEHGSNIMRLINEIGQKDGGENR